MQDGRGNGILRAALTSKAGAEALGGQEERNASERAAENPHPQDTPCF